MIRFRWPPDAVAMLRLMAPTSSARSIAALLGTTKSAVIGKAWREKIAMRGQKLACAAANRTSGPAQSIAMRAWWSKHPEARAALSERMKAYNASRRARP